MTLRRSSQRCGVELRFVQPVDLAGRIANLLGAGLKTQVGTRWPAWTWM